MLNPQLNAEMPPITDDVIDDAYNTASLLEICAFTAAEIADRAEEDPYLMRLARSLSGSIEAAKKLADASIDALERAKDSLEKAAA